MNMLYAFIKNNCNQNVWNWFMFWRKCFSQKHFSILNKNVCIDFYVWFHLCGLLYPWILTSIRQSRDILKNYREIIVSSITLDWKKKINQNNLLSIVEFQKLWRSVPVDSIDEEKIEEYLKKQGISSMQETGPKKVVSGACSPISLSFILVSQINCLDLFQ